MSCTFPGTPCVRDAARSQDRARATAMSAAGGCRRTNPTQQQKKERTQHEQNAKYATENAGSAPDAGHAAGRHAVCGAWHGDDPGAGGGRGRACRGRACRERGGSRQCRHSSHPAQSGGGRADMGRSRQREKARGSHEKADHAADLSPRIPHKARGTYRHFRQKRPAHLGQDARHSDTGRQAPGYERLQYLL